SDGSTDSFSREERALDPRNTRQNHGLVGGSSSQLPPNARSATKSQRSRNSTGCPSRFATRKTSFTRSRIFSDESCFHATLRGQIIGSSHVQSSLLTRSANKGSARIFATI